MWCLYELVIDTFPAMSTIICHTDIHLWGVCVCAHALLHLNGIYSPVTMVIDTGTRALAGHCH